MRCMKSEGRGAGNHNGRERAVGACKLLNQLWADIKVAEDLMDFLAKVPNDGKYLGSEEDLVSLGRMVLSHLVLVLAKLGEVHRHYSKILPEGCQRESKALKMECEARRVPEFRNSVVGHVLGRELKCPMTVEEVEALSLKVTKGDREAFSQWLRNPAELSDRSTVMGKVEWILHTTMAAYQITAEELGLHDSRG